MKRIFTVCMSIFIGLTLFFAATPLSAYAADGLFTDACADAPDSPTCNATQNNTTNPLTGTNGTLMRVSRIIAIVAGIAAVIVIIISGFQYITASGDAQKAKKARGALIGALIGLAVIALAAVIITFVINSSGV